MKLYEIMPDPSDVIDTSGVDPNMAPIGVPTHEPYRDQTTGKNKSKAKRITTLMRLKARQANPQHSETITPTNASSFGINMR